MATKKTRSGWWDARALLISLLVSLCGCFFLSIFNNIPNQVADRRQEYTDQAWYYVSRGYPTPWAGVTASDHQVPFPLIKAPLQMANEIDGHRYQKIIDLGILVPMLVIIMIPIYCGIVLTFKTLKTKVSQKNFTIASSIILGIIFLFLYYFWFPRT